MLHPIDRMISLDDLQLFLAVAHEGRFVAAARRLGVPTSTLSRRVAALEATLGVRLLQRTSRRVALTQEGARLVERSSSALEDLRRLLDEAMDRDREPAGRLRVTAPALTGATLIAPALFAFAKAHPRITLELNLTNQVVPLVEDRYDLAFRVGPIQDRDLIARRLWSFEQAFAASPSLVREHLAGRTRIARSALEKLPAVMTRPSARSFRLLRSNDRIDEVPALVRARVNDPRAAIAAASAGLGVVCTSRDVLAAHGAELITLTIIGLRPAPVELFAVYPSRALVPARVRAALDWVIAHVRSERRLR